MTSQRTLLGLVIGSTLAFAAAADTGSLRWRGEGKSIGLRANTSISMEAGHVDAGSPMRMARPQGTKVSLVGKTGFVPDLRVYGRVGTFVAKSGPSVGPAAYGEDSGLTYGMGLNFKLSRQASASVGVDSYDVRTATGEWRDIRAASLGLQLRY